MKPSKVFGKGESFGRTFSTKQGAAGGCLLTLQHCTSNTINEKRPTPLEKKNYPYNRNPKRGTQGPSPEEGRTLT